MPPRSRRFKAEGSEYKWRFGENKGDLYVSTAFYYAPFHQHILISLSVSILVARRWRAGHRNNSICASPLVLKTLLIALL
jgi:hypothetical protein